MIKIILVDENGVCWKFGLTKDMHVVEILVCVSKQFYSIEHSYRTGGKE